MDLDFSAFDYDIIICLYIKFIEKNIANTPDILANHIESALASGFWGFFLKWGVWGFFYSKPILENKNPFFVLSSAFELAEFYQVMNS